MSDMHSFHVSCILSTTITEFLFCIRLFCIFVLLNDRIPSLNKVNISIREQLVYGETLQVTISGMQSFRFQTLTRQQNGQATLYIIKNHERICLQICKQILSSQVQISTGVTDKWRSKITKWITDRKISFFFDPVMSFRRISDLRA